MLRWVFILY